ncbi:MAG: ABC transporter ATP-binding protein [Proteobacteria bacterium]|nr:ABC transporter ATP-binding protein [Pseudomonadota bacterium]
MAEVTRIEAVGVSKAYRVGDRRVQALSRVSLRAAPAETLAVVGESGSGKSTLGRILLGVERPDEGEIRLDSAALSLPLPKAMRRRLQVVQQNPLSTLNPRRTVGQSVALPLRVHRLVAPRQTTARVRELLDLVGLPTDTQDRYPNALSGGQRQRAALARALAAEPDLIVLDEPTSALDVSVQARVLHLLIDLQARIGLTYIFITHDLSVVRNIAARVAVLYRGRVVETGPTEAVFRRPRHRYTTMLLSAIPVVSAAEEAVKPQWPQETRAQTAEAESAGCTFAPRCPFALDPCWRTPPPIESADGRHFAACYNPKDATS